MNFKCLTRILLFSLLVQGTAQAQYWNGQDSVYGHEWINFDQTYFKFKVAADGIYRIDRNVLLNEGLPVDRIEARHLQFWRLGEEVPVLATTDGLMEVGDHFLLHLEKNRGEFDTHLYPNGIKDQLNPDYSLFTDSIACFITWNASIDGLRMSEVPNDLSNLPNEEPYFMDEIENVLHDTYLNYCQDLNCYIVFSHYDKGEGWARNSGSHINNFTLYPKYVFQNGPDAQLITRTSNNLTQAAASGNVNISIDGQNIARKPYSERPFVYEDSLVVDIEDVHSGMDLTIAGDNQSQLLAIAKYGLIYPRKFRFELDSFYDLTIEGSRDDKHIFVQNFSGGDTLLVWDTERREFQRVTPESANNYRFRLSAHDAHRSITLVNPELSPMKIESVDPVNFVNLNDQDAEFIIITHPRFMDGSVRAYAEYRQSPDGGDFETTVMNIHDLADQFAYGIDKHPSAIRHFVHWIVDNWSEPQYIFLIGKGVVSEDTRNSDIDWNTVPTFGSPGSDMLLTSDAALNPLLPIGRIPVIDPGEVEDYLEKVRMHEASLRSPQSVDGRHWSKRAIHLSGGNLNLPAEISNIRNGLDIMKDTLESSMMAPHVYTFQKKTSRTIEVSDNQRLTGLINDGISLVTYFGHSGVQLIDFQIIDDVATLPENDKFHVFMAMGCYAGDIFHEQRRSYSEAWTLADRRGSIAFVANSSAGFIPTLRTLGTRIYDNYGNRYYGQSIGIGIKESIGEFIEENRFGNSLSFNINVQLAFSLNICGDPAIRFVTGETPDYTVDPESVSLQEKIITTRTDSVTLDLNVHNLGKYVPGQPLDIRVEQTLPDGELVTLLEKVIPAPAFVDSLTLRLPGLGEKAAGSNLMNIVLDAPHEIEELPAPEAESNNSLRLLDREYRFFVTADDARPIYPREFAIVGESPVRLVASTSDGHLNPKSYLIEIDTTEYFDSPLKRSTQVDQAGGVIDWEPSVDWTDNTVYYWRVSPDSTGRGRLTWRTSSFVFIGGHPTGWNQSHYFQFIKGDLDSIVLEEPTREWNFIPEITTFKIRNAIVDDVNFLRPAVLNEGGVLWEYYQTSPWDQDTATQTTREGVYVCIFDPRRLQPVKNPSPGDHGSINTSGREIDFFAYNTNRYTDRVALMELLEDHVPKDHYVFFITVREPGLSYGLDAWASDRDSTVGQSILDVLENRSASRLDELRSTNEFPYVFVYQEGNGDFQTVEDIGNATGMMEVKAHLAAFWSEGRGSSRSPEIGPVSSWNHLIWQGSEIVPGQDDMSIQLYGITPANNEELLLSDIRSDSTDLSLISVDQYPGLKLRLRSSDKVDLTSPQLDLWRITYAGIPEFAVDLERDFFFYADTLQQGEDLQLLFGIENVSEQGSDSLLISYTIIDEKNNVIEVSDRIRAFDAFDRVSTTFTLNTRTMVGDHRLIVTINPNKDQRELTDVNNSFVLPFFVKADIRNPILGVTFDGVHIDDGDLVSARPVIDIYLTDENEFLLLQDTSLFDIWLQYPNESFPEKVYFSDPDVEFIPAESEENKARVLLKRSFPVDGIYRLIVRARDVSENNSGDLDYMVNFEVINEQRISGLFNYPNPFMHTTRFVYTLTGGAPPDECRIEIMTLSGKLIRTITSDELGPLRVGTHTTEFVFDGTDGQGNKIASGAYLYRLTALDKDGRRIPHPDPSESNEDWGKMIILR